jgi:hypothetical protein
MGECLVLIMARPNPQTVCDALTALRRFFVDFENSKYTRVLPLERYIRTIKDGGLNKALLEELEHVKGELYTQAREQISYGRRLIGPYETEAKSLAELDRVIILLRDALDPPEPPLPTMDVSAFAGSEYVEAKDTAYIGDPESVRSIFEQSVAIVRRHTEAIGRGDYAAAYEDLASDTRSWMSLKRFLTAHEEASKRYFGPPLSFQIGGFAPILADEAARKKSKLEQGWPKTSPKESRRAKLNGFWFRDQQNHGCYGTFWITEEAGKYRIAKFNFWSM